MDPFTGIVPIGCLQKSEQKTTFSDHAVDLARILGIVFFHTLSRNSFIFTVSIFFCLVLWAGRSAVPLNTSHKADSYQGIWFTLNQFSEEGDKYSGGLRTYTAKHVPMAIYGPEVEKIFLVYGGAKERQDIYWRWPPTTITHTIWCLDQRSCTIRKMLMTLTIIQASRWTRQDMYGCSSADGVVVGQASSTEAWNPTALICLGWLVKKR